MGGRELARRLGELPQECGFGCRVDGVGRERHDEHLLAAERSIESTTGTG